MRNVLFSLFLLVTTTSFAASELTFVDEPEKETNAQVAALLKKSGYASSFKSSKRVFFRDGVKVAALITTVRSMGGRPPVTTKFVQFYIDLDNWIQIDLSDPRRFESRFVVEANVSATDDSITVTAPKKRYCEVFFKSTATFMDGATREQLAPSFLEGAPVPK